MDVSRFVTESAAFTRAALFDKPSRWLIFILLGLPWMALSSLFESRKILEGATLHWGLIPWQEAGLLIGAAIVCNFLSSGWVVRLLRDDPVPPDFDRPLLLCLDGIKVHAIPLVWMLVPSILAFVQYSLARGSTVTVDLLHPDPVTILILLLLAVQILIFFIAVQYGLVGAIRFARTGSIREAFDIPGIKKTLDRIGIVNYFIGLGVVTLTGLLFSYGIREAALVPYAGPVLALCLSPIPTVYCFRFIAHFCDEEKPMAGLRESGPCTTGSYSAPLTTPEWIREYIAWLAIVAILTILCFTPAAIIVASLVRLIP